MSSNEIKIPGLQYPPLPPTTEPSLAQAIKNVIDNLFYLRNLAGSSSAGEFTTQQLTSLEKIIADQFITILTTNAFISNFITNITNTTINNTGFVEFGDHATRLTLHAADPLGSMYFETDRTSLYVMIDSPDRWRFAAGIMLADIYDRPTDLGADDSGFIFLDLIGLVLYVWDGSAWVSITVDVESAGYWAPITNGDPVDPELIFDAFGNVVVAFTPTP